jgi:hypothetical protein
MLIQNNFGFRIKIFGEVTELIRKDMDKYIMELINDYYKDILSVNHWKYFIYETRSIKNSIEAYIKCLNLNLFKLIINHYEIFLTNFNKEKKKELDSNINEKTLDLTQYKDIENKYQKILDIFCSKKDLLEYTFEEIDIYKNKNDEINNKEKSDFLSIKKDGSDNIINKKISLFSLEIFNFIYDYFLVLIELSENINTNNGDNKSNNEGDNDNLRKDLISNMYKEIKDKLEYSKEITINNKSGIVNNKQITDKETSIYYSDITLIEIILNKFIIKYPSEEISSLLSEIKTKCVDLIIQLTNDTTNKIFEDFNALDFSNYPIVNGGKGYNKYVNYFTILKRIYDNMCNCFSKEQMNEIIKDELKNLFNKISQDINKKGIIENEEQLKQIRNEFNYIKKVLKLFHDIDTNDLKDIIDEFIIKVNQDKLPVNKKKKTGQNKGKDKEENKENEEK